MSTKQPVPSVLARLMGLDEMPPQQPVQKKPRVLSENYLRRVASIGVRDKCPERHSFRLSVEEQDECKNVLQVSEILRRNKRHVSGCNKLKETNDVYWQSGHVAVSRSPCASDCRDNSMSRKFRRKSEEGYGGSRKKIPNGQRLYSSREVSFNEVNNKSCRFNLKLNNSSCITTSIVLLKPNLGKADGAGSCFSSSPQPPDASDSGNGKIHEVLTSHNWNMCVEKKGRKSTSNGIRPVRGRSRFLRERTKNLGHGITSTSLMEPSSEISSREFVKEARSTIPSSPILSDRKSLVYSLDGSFVSREAKKKISERWKTTKRFQQLELASRSKTLGDMLAIPDKSSKCSPSSQDGSHIGDVNFCNALGISRWVGRKNECVRDLPRSRSLLACFNAVGNANTKISHEPLEKGGYMGALETIDLVPNKLKERDLNQKDGAEFRSIASSYRNSQAYPYLESQNNCSLGDNNVVQNEWESNFNKDSGRQFSVVCKSSGRNNETLQDTWMKEEGHKDEARENLLEQIPVVPESSMRSAFSICTVVNQKDLLAEEEYSSHIQDTSVQQEITNEIFEADSVSSQYSGTDPESLMSAEEAYQPSPNSVLEPLYKKEFSPISDCFKSVNASLHGLHMQLEFLKSEELETYSEVSSMMVSSDEDTEEVSNIDYEEKEDLMRLFRVEESRDFSYLVDVLAEAGFHHVNLHADLDAWHSQECPISHSVFEILEKKYGEQISWKRSERKLLFDRINSGLFDILLASVGVLTWSKPVSRRLNISQGQGMIEEELWTTLVNQEKEVSKKLFGKYDGWMELDDDIQIIGREIENSLIDELVADVSMESF